MGAPQFWTPLQPSGGQNPAKAPTFGADTPMGRAGQPAELASACVTLASQESSYAAQVYGVNGGSAPPHPGFPCFFMREGASTAHPSARCFQRQVTDRCR